MNPVAAESSRAVIERMIPDSFSRRTRWSVAAGERLDESRELDVRAVGVALELLEQLQVNKIK